MKDLLQFPNHPEHTSGRREGCRIGYPIATPLRHHSQQGGHALVYVIVVMLIFAALGVGMLSVFSTSSSSTARINDSRRAIYLKESGIRYALSELRNTGFDDDVIEALNTTTFDLQQESSFTLNVFGPWFDANETKNITGGSTSTLDLKLPHGRFIPAWLKICDNSDLAAPSCSSKNIWLVNFDYVDDLNPTMARNPIESWASIDATTLRVTMSGDFNVRKDDRLCLSVWPTHTQTINSGGDLYVEEYAKDFFPLTDGAINIRRIDYTYKRLVHEPGYNRVKLENVTATGMPNQADPWVDELSAQRQVLHSYDGSTGNWNGDFVILSPRNFQVIPTGRSGNVVTAGALEDSLNVVDFSDVNPMSARADIDAEILTSNIGKKETTTGFIGVNTTDDTLDVGGGTSRVDTEFGAAWYGGDLTLGGSTNFCQTGACRFGRGIRAFFLLKYSGSGEGLTFSLFNSALNSINSIGGDKDMPELLAYAGDSRLDSAGTSFLDNVGRGLRAPKMAMEFDARPNSTKYTYCSGSLSSQFNTGTRNDPDGGTGRNALQYVYWGFNDSLTINCRPNGNPLTYDDNRHDNAKGQLQWESELTGNRIRSDPTVGPDGTIYVGSNLGRVYAFNPDGSVKWRYPSASSIGAVISSPVLGANGIVYVGADDNKLYGISASTGSKVYEFSAPGPVRGSPVIGSGDKVYVGTEDTNNPANSKFYGFSSSLTKLWEFTLPGPISYGRPPVSSSGIIYVSSRATSNNYVWALNPSQRELGASFPSTGEWQFSIWDSSERMPGIDPTTGNILSDRSGNTLVSITPTGGQDWTFDALGADFDSTPVAGTDGTIYFGADNGRLYAINPGDRNNGLAFPTSREWSYQTGSEIDTTPAITPDGTIVFVSLDGNLYALNKDGTLKWSYPIPVNSFEGRPNSSPAVGNSGTVYIGGAFPSTVDGRLYALPDFAVPRNFFDKLVTSTNDGKVAGESVSLTSTDNWFRGDNSKPWAVRMEVNRSLSPNAGGKYVYLLRAWIRQCNNATLCDNALDSFFEDTRVTYTAKPPHIEQEIELDNISPDFKQDSFTRFLFGFTGAVAAGDNQSALISEFKLSFIRFNDPVISSDPKWP